MKGGVKLKLIYYVKLRELMARYGLTKNDIAKIIGMTYRQTSKILHRETSPVSGKPYVFDIIEATKIVLYFRQLGEDGISMDSLFFDDTLSNENIRGA